MDWGQEEKGMTEDEMTRWHHWLDRCESEWTPGVGDGQGGLGCCDSWGRKKSDMTVWLKWTESNENKRDMMKLNRVEGKCYSEWLRWGIFIYPISVPKPTVPSPLHFFSLNPCPVIDFCSAVLNKLWFSDSGMKLELCGFTRIGNYSFKLFRCSLLYPWTIKKPECQRIDAFELWYWRRLLRLSWTARRSNQSILKEINSDNSLEGLMLKLKLQYFGHKELTHWKRLWCWER